MAIRSLAGYSDLAQVMPAGEKKFAPREYIGPANYDKQAKGSESNIRNMAAGFKEDAIQKIKNMPSAKKPNPAKGGVEEGGLIVVDKGENEGKPALPEPLLKPKGEEDGVGKFHPPGGGRHWKENDPANKHRDNFLNKKGTDDGGEGEGEGEGKPKPSAAAPPVPKRPRINPVAGKTSTSKGPEFSRRKTYDFHHLKEAQRQRDEAAQLRRALASTAYAGDIEGHIASESQIAGLTDAAAANEAKGVLVDSDSVKYSPPEVESNIKMHNPKSVLEAQKMVDDSLPNVSAEILQKFREKQKQFAGG